jgi:GH15 family glucan-1,4-alpha-glucosidase
MPRDRYPLIEDHGFISDCHSVALVARDGSIVWCCMPRLDAESMFGSLLDRDRGGTCRLGPAGNAEVTRRYLERTLVLETTFATKDGEARLIDFYVMREGGRKDPARQIVRIVEGIRGSVELEISVAPRFDYGAVRPWTRSYGDGVFTTIGGDDGLVIQTDAPLEIVDAHDLEGRVTVESDERVRLSMAFALPEDLDRGPPELPDVEALDDLLDECVSWWRSWADKGTYPDGETDDPVLRSALVIKGLTMARTGAIAAAATTSLPEVPGGDRNWDYRYTWVRDSTWAVRSLYELDHDEEADGFRRFIERTAAGSVEDLQICYGVAGERRLHELTLDDLEGYRGAQPVRVGNAAAHQHQHDVYGELLELAWEWHTRGHKPDQDYWGFLVEAVEAAARRWTEPDHGIWETRDEPEHFVYSKVMCWSAIDHGIRLAEESHLDAPTDRWSKTREEIRQAIEGEGYDGDRGVFVRSFGSTEVDGALLLIPRVRFVEWADERMVRTVDAIREDLEEDGLLMRFRSDLGEGAFLPCSFWLAECLAHQGRVEEAERVFDRAMGTGNDLGLFSEEFDTDAEEMLGNFPQALTHLSLISAALAIHRARREA